MKNFHIKHRSQRGDIAVYVALIVITVLLSGALLLSGILSRQARFASNIVHNERAFYAADSGVEATLYELKNNIDLGDASVSRVSGEIEYSGQKASFTGSGNLTVSADQARTLACVSSSGSFASESRQLVTGPQGCEVE
ncbi:MAG: hypothetical protein HYZ63_03670 [Candidatus Andersenbacteria bacterium]|nr:hypothetical protein [Candidatus Andersenbacteria bacterium]